MNVYKYRFGSKRDLDSLQQNYFYAPNSLELNDPYEGIFIDEILDATGLHHLFKNDFSRFYKEVKNYGIYSLSKTEKDELLWAYYANAHKGFCIEYDQEILLKIESIKLNCIVQYDVDIPKLNFSSVFHHNSISKLNELILGTKSKRWLHEDEIRIIINHFGKVEYDARAVKAIYFGLRMPKTKQDLHDDNKKLSDSSSQVSQEQVMEVLKGRNIKYYQMALKPNSYEFEYNEVVDPYGDAEKYKNTVKFIDKSLIDYNGYGWEIDTTYFDKVAEIIRRDPYFYKLACIAISVNDPRSKIEPIIYAHFYKTEEEISPIKKNFTLQEIDNFYEKLHLA